MRTSKTLQSMWPQSSNKQDRQVDPDRTADKHHTAS